MARCKYQRKVQGDPQYKKFRKIIEPSAENSKLSSIADSI